jgi:co-chaperonin GroES (HSP10)
MPQTREAIKHAPVSNEVWRNNRTQVGGLWFDPLKIQPLGDHILVQLDEEKPLSELIEAPDIAKNQEIAQRFGVVIAVGPGKWYQKQSALEKSSKTQISWILNKLIFKPTTLKPGDRVAIGHFSDWESWSADFEGRGRNVVLCQEADVRVVFDSRPISSRKRKAADSRRNQSSTAPAMAS